jgi:O-antigen/teichoic acid export membrane protein
VLGLSLLSVASVGLFNAASRIPQQLYFLPLVVRISTFPILSEAWVTDRVRFRRLLNSLLGTSLLISVPLALLGVGLAEPLTRALFGSAFQDAALPFKILMVTFAIMFPAILVGEAMTAAGFQRVNLIINMAGVPVMILLLLFLLAPGGATGAATALLGSMAFIAAATLITAPRYLEGPISLAPLIFGTVAAALGAAILVLAHGLGSVPAALLAAVGAAVVLGLADRSTFRLLWGIQPFHISSQHPIDG